MPTELSQTEAFDVFISHASEDKDFVDPLADALAKAGIRVWYDNFVLDWGDDLRSSIDEGLAKSKYGIVVFSPAFLKKKKWTEHELNGLFAKEKAGQRVILPILHKIKPQDLLAYGPAFADRLAKDSQRDSITEIVLSLRVKLRKVEDTSKQLVKDSSIESPPKISNQVSAAAGSAPWGIPTEAEVSAVLSEMERKHTDSFLAIESLYSIPRANREAIRKVIKQAMAAGGILRLDGRKWGIEDRVTAIRLVDLKENIHQSPDQSQTSNIAVVTGLWNLTLHPEPQISSSFRISPGAAFLVLEIADVQNEKWTRIRLETGREGWLQGPPEKNIIAQSGMIAKFSYEDTRVFFTTLQDNRSCLGFLLHRVSVGRVFGSRGDGGDLKEISFVEAEFGEELQIPNHLIQRIDIDRSRGVPVILTTRTRIYKGDFYEDKYNHRDFVVVGRPFVNIADVSKEVDLVSTNRVMIEKAVTPEFCLP